MQGQLQDVVQDEYGNDKADSDSDEPEDPAPSARKAHSPNIGRSESQRTLSHGRKESSQGQSSSRPPHQRRDSTTSESKAPIRYGLWGEELGP